ncbi:ATP-dependent RNA helicase DHX36-like [Pyrus ussuriensis x Pyrus communis]|uniref:ATP-dependent RNA helicase DHX36-like n=1 Tax=Pyrus ussuriensis x Pyrus communis TaxID=2448454 RepID=A0A5N5FY48_9ROSA|nr:ATP-dependent RNA helicase DHX36-like [Pyrus ussuriensis x Pyrus communis]
MNDQPPSSYDSIYVPPTTSSALSSLSPIIPPLQSAPSSAKPDCFCRCYSQSEEQHKWCSGVQLDSTAAGAVAKAQASAAFCLRRRRF